MSDAVVTPPRSKWAERYSPIVKATRNGSAEPAAKRSCEKCGAQAAHRHHDDYTKPLEVTYLCAKCHMARHKELGWGIGGRRLDPLNLLDIPVFDFAVYHGAKIANVSMCAHNMSRAQAGSKFKCFAAGNAVVVFRVS